MPTGFSKGPPLRFHLNLPTDEEDEDMHNRVVAIWPTNASLAMEAVL